MAVGNNRNVMAVVEKENNKKCGGGRNRNVLLVMAMVEK